MTLLQRLALLNALWCARVAGDDPEQTDTPDDPIEEVEDDPDVEPIEVDEPEGDAADEPEGAEDDAPAARKTTRRDRSDEIADLRAETRRLDRELEQERRDRQRPRGPTPDQAVFDREQALLANPELSEMDRHAIETNRALRQSHNISTTALQRAEDMSDKSEYNLKAIDNPVYRKMSDRVEKERQRIAGTGNGVPPRQVVLAYLLGQDMLKGKVKPAAPKAKVARPQPTKARSDVRANTGRSEQEKRRARLENQLI